MATHDLHFHSLIGPGVAPVEKAYVEVKSANDYFIDGTAVVWRVPREYPFTNGEATIPAMADTDEDGNDVVWAVRQVFTDGRGNVVGPSQTTTFKFTDTAGPVVEWTDTSAVEETDPVEPIEWGPTYLAQTKELRDETQEFRDETVAVGTTNDAIIAGRIADPASATKAALNATIRQVSVGVRTADGNSLPDGLGVVLTIDKTLAQIIANPVAEVADITFEEIA